MNNVNGKDIDSKGGVLSNSMNRTCDPRNLDAIHLRRRGQLVQHINRLSRRDEWHNEPKNMAPYHSFSYPFFPFSPLLPFSISLLSPYDKQVNKQCCHCRRL